MPGSELLHSALRASVAVRYPRCIPIRPIIAEFKASFRLDKISTHTDKGLCLQIILRLCNEVRLCARARVCACVSGRCRSLQPIPLRLPVRIDLAIGRVRQRGLCDLWLRPVCVCVCACFSTAYASVHSYMCCFSCVCVCARVCDSAAPKQQI